LQGSYQEIEIARLEGKVEQAKLLPDINFGYFSQSIIGIQEINGIPLYFSSSDRFTGIEAGVSIPLWFYPQASRIKASKIKKQIADNNARNTEANLIGEYNSLLKENEKFKNSLSYYEQLALPQAVQIINQAEKSFKAGAMDYMDYIQNLSRAVSIKHNYLETLNQYNQTILAIEYLTTNN